MDRYTTTGTALNTTATETCGTYNYKGVVAWESIFQVITAVNATFVARRDAAEANAQSALSCRGGANEDKN